jgi:GxxExxY protein
MSDKEDTEIAEDNKDLTGLVIGAAMEVHTYCGPGLLESAYQDCLVKELELRGIKYEQAVIMPFNYKGHLCSKAYVIDMLVEKTLIVELKSVETILPVHRDQLRTYLKASNLKTGLLLNFKVLHLREGINRIMIA